ncbi:MAG TPA: lactate utilization protein, partial [Anaerolineales bacterium]|nr:lactate utilization protein [Anaerolineales bacterium]
DSPVSGGGESVGKPAPVERFKAELEALGGVFVSCHVSELAQQLVDLFHRKGVERLQSWAPAALPAGLVDALQSAGLSLQTEPDPHLAAGLTGALAGVAETGSLILTSGEDRPLTASLLPEIHVAVLAAERIVPTLAQFFGRSAAGDLDLVRAAASTVLISGPSRTADIEMTLTVGVHGPRELYVFCLTG